MRSICLSCSLLMAAAVVGCDSVELTIGVRPAADGSLEVTNANDAEWVDARLVVEAVESDNSTILCSDRTIASWRPNQAVPIPVCGNKIRLSLTTGGETARFTYANGQLYRRFGRKDVPVSDS